MFGFKVQRKRVRETEREEGRKREEGRESASDREERKGESERARDSITIHNCKFTDELSSRIHFYETSGIN